MSDLRWCLARRAASGRFVFVRGEPRLDAAVAEVLWHDWSTHSLLQGELAVVCLPARSIRARQGGYRNHLRVGHCCGRLSLRVRMTEKYMCA